jgi:hypothetical protein
MDKPPSQAIYSVSWRLMRTTVEYAYVGVPVADEMVKPDEQGVNRIDVKAMSDRAIELGHRHEVVWYLEEQKIELHSVQKAPDESENRFHL